MLTRDAAPPPLSINVQRAAGYLDYFHPGWFYQVDPDTLSVFSCTRCILGQVFGLTHEHGRSWTDKMRDLFGNDELVGLDPKTSPLGFSRGVFAAPHYEAEWIEAIRQRHEWASLAAAQATERPSEADACCSMTSATMSVRIRA